ncbi:hypothetical protein BY458DRAFT_555707 [Sporodiniella umbellata]|nr:hypothetical protein BY458DRAFT_555707 [Sporodiniella umbellata]
MPRKVAKKYHQTLEEINVATFAYLYHTNTQVEECLAHFFTAILPFHVKVIERDVELYFQLKLDLFLNHVSESHHKNMKELLNRYFPLDLLKYGDHLENNMENFIIPKKALELRTKIRNDLKQLLIEHEKQPNSVYVYFLAYIRERIEKFEHPEKFERWPMSYMEELPSSRVLVQMDWDSPVDHTNELSEDDSYEDESGSVDEEQYERIVQESFNNEPSEEDELRESEDEMIETEKEEQEKRKNTQQTRRDRRRVSFAVRTPCGPSSTINVPNNLKLRKEREPWTLKEIQALETGIVQIKKPLWVDIKNRVAPSLDNRSNAQIKDKAYGEIKKRRRENEDLGIYAYIIKKQK